MKLYFYEKILEWGREGTPFAVATIIETVGSTPRPAGAKMLISEDLEIFGTIGGGCVEGDVIKLAREVIREGRPRVLDVDLTMKNPAELDMRCGGRLKILIEPVQHDDRLIIFGGGHVSLAIHNICRLLDFEITVVEDRPQFGNRQRFPDARHILVGPWDEQLQKIPITPRTYLVIVTRGHSSDEEILRWALSLPEPRPRYIGMMGSRTKWVAIKRKLADEGFARELLDQVHCPIGIKCGSVTPEEIAVSIAAELIQVRAGRPPGDQGH
ncbi:MAG: XdhC/CoxI family protein [Candidatus Sumerlaeia bacterium]